MTEKELIAKIKEFKQIKPEKDWVFLAKNQIFGEEIDRGRASASFVSFFPFLRLKPALAGLTVFVILFGLFGFSQNSVPGDFLYSIKRIMEKSQAVFVSEQDRPEISLELTNRRLEELTRILEANQVRKLASALDEFQASISQAAQNISKMEAVSSGPTAVKNIVERTKKIEEKMQEVKSLGAVIESGELTEAVNKLEVNLLISDLKTRTLIDERQEEVLSEMKELAQDGKYSEALELFLLEFNQTGEMVEEEVFISSEPAEDQENEAGEEDENEEAEEEK